MEVGYIICFVEVFMDRITISLISWHAAFYTHKYWQIQAFPGFSCLHWFSLARNSGHAKLVACRARHEFLHSTRNKWRKKNQDCILDFTRSIIEVAEVREQNKSYLQHEEPFSLGIKFIFRTSQGQAIRLLFSVAIVSLICWLAFWLADRPIEDVLSWDSVTVGSRVQ